MSNRLGGKQGTAYTGTNANQPPNWTFNDDRDPNQYDTQNVEVGDLWMNLSTGVAWILISLAGNSTSKGALAEWVRFAGGNGDVEFLEGNTGGPVGPNASSIINVVGDNFTIVIDGDPATNTLTASLTENIATSYPTDSGTAIPAGGELDIFGDGHNITTTGSVNEVVVGLTGITEHSLQVGGASQSLTQLGVATDGQLPIGSTGSDPVLSTLIAGSNINITNGAGFIAISSTNPGGTVTTLHTDDGHNVTATAGVINITGGTGIVTSGTIGANTVTITATGTPPPGNFAAFDATNSANVTNVTGDGTVYFPVHSIISFNQAGAYDGTTGKFTAPVAGIYHFDMSIAFSNVGSATGGNVTFYVNGSNDVIGTQINTGAVKDSNQFEIITGTCVLELAGGDVVYPSMYASGTSKSVGFGIAAGSSHFAGFLIQAASTIGIQSVPTNSGTAVPSAGVLNVLGSNGIVTTGSSNTVTIAPPGTGVSFYVYLSANITNATGDGTLVTLPFNTVQYDSGSNFDTTNHWFLAPITGIYYFNLTVDTDDMPIASTGAFYYQSQYFVNGSNVANAFHAIFPEATVNPSAYIVSGPTLLSLTAGDQVDGRLIIGGCTKTVTIEGGGPTATSFMGYLVG